MSGCVYTENAGTPARTCGKVCDPEQTMCPRHVLVSIFEASEKITKEKRRTEAMTAKKKAALRHGARR